MASNTTVTLLSDAGPLITLAYADALDLLMKSGWSVALVDMVLHEVTRNETPTSARIAAWARENSIPVLQTRIYERYMQSQTAQSARKANLGELAIQEVMSGFGLAAEQTGVFLFEDHKIARASFLLPDNCRKVSTCCSGSSSRNCSMRASRSAAKPARVGSCVSSRSSISSSSSNGCAAICAARKSP